VALEAKLLQL